MNQDIVNNPRQPSGILGDLWTDGSGEIFVGKDWALQNEMDEVKEKTRSRGCFKECRTCGCCANSMRDGSSCTRQYDHKAKKDISCTKCEKFRFCDCRNGFFRNARGDAEPFTPDVLKFLKEHDGKPLI